MTRKRAIVTGATGFIGSNMCRRLVNDGWEVWATGRIDENGLAYLSDIKDQIHLVDCQDNGESLLDWVPQTQADVVFHFASVFITDHHPSQIPLLIQSNIMYGTFLLEAMKAGSTRLIINTGTGFQHMNCDSFNPVNLYASTKEAMEVMMRYYTSAEGFRAITMKIFDSYGENDRRKKLLGLFKDMLANGSSLEMSPGEQEIDLVHVDDITNGFLKAYEHLIANTDVVQADFALPSGYRMTLREMVSLIENTTNKKLNISWGAKPYKAREVMQIWKGYQTLPNWEITIPFPEGIRRLFAEK